jgi:hypothetical protein
MSKLSTYAEARNGMNDRNILGDIEAERREEAQDSGRIGSLNLLTINPAVLWVMPSDSSLLLGPVPCVFMSRSKTVVLEPML